MTELGTDNLGTGQGTWHNHVSRPKLSLDFDAPGTAMEVDVPSSTTEAEAANSTAVNVSNRPTSQQDSVAPIDSAQVALAAEQARQAAVRAAEAAAAAAATRAAQNVQVNVATPDRHFDVETEPSAEYEKVEDYELEEGAVEPELPESNSVQVRTSATPPVRPIAVRAPGHAISVRTEASNATDTHAGTSTSNNHANFSAATADRPAERHPYQVHAAEARAARRQLEEQIRHATHPTVSTQERKDIAIARALAAVQPIEQENDVLARNVSSSAPQLDTTRSKRQKHKKEKSGLSTGRRFALAFAVAQGRESEGRMQDAVSADGKRGIRLRAGTEAEIYNTIVKGKPMCITTETNETETSLINGISKLEYITLENTITSEDNGYSETMFLADGTNSINADITLSNCYVGTLGNGKTLSDDFFDNAAYQGAVPSDNDWTNGWTLK